MPVVIIDQPELTVYGPAEQVDVQVEIGPTGRRGSMIFSNIGHPDGYTTSSGSSYELNGETLYFNDMYYRVDVGRYYQFVSKPTGPAWEDRTGIGEIYRAVIDVVFTSGIGEISIQTTDIWNDTGVADLVEDNFVVSLTGIDAQNPIITVTNKELDTDVPRNLILTLAGASLNSSTFLLSALSGTVSVDVLIATTQT